MDRKAWALVAANAGLISVGVESVQERDVSSTVLVLAALVALTVFVRTSERRDSRR